MTREGTWFCDQDQTRVSAANTPHTTQAVETHHSAAMCLDRSESFKGPHSSGSQSVSVYWLVFRDTIQVASTICTRSLFLATTKRSFDYLSAAEVANHLAESFNEECLVKSNFRSVCIFSLFPRIHSGGIILFLGTICLILLTLYYGRIFKALKVKNFSSDESQARRQESRGRNDDVQVPFILNPSSCMACRGQL